MKTNRKADHKVNDWEYFPNGNGIGWLNDTTLQKTIVVEYSERRRGWYMCEIPGSVDPDSVELYRSAEEAMATAEQKYKKSYTLNKGNPMRTYRRFKVEEPTLEEIDETESEESVEAVVADAPSTPEAITATNDLVDAGFTPIQVLETDLPTGATGQAVVSDDGSINITYLHPDQPELDTSTTVDTIEDATAFLDKQEEATKRWRKSQKSQSRSTRSNWTRVK